MADDNDLNAMDCNTANGQNDWKEDGDQKSMATNDEANENQDSDSNTDTDDASLTVHQYCRYMSRLLSHSRPVGPARREGRGVGPNRWLGSRDETLTKVF